MAYFTKNTDLDDDAPSAELVSVERDPSAAQIVFNEDSQTDPTRADLAYGYTQRYLPTQNGGYLGQVLTQDQISYLMGPQQLPTPRALVRVHNLFAHAAQSPLAPAAGVLTLAGLSVWAHGEPYHPLIGGIIIAVGALLIRSAVRAHRAHGTDADEMFTKGAAVAGLGTILIGTGVTAGLSRWEGLAVGVGTFLWYGVRAAVKSRNLERARGFAVGLVAAGNTGPAVALPWNPSPTPWGGPVSNEEFRLRKAFAAVKGEQVILGAIRRIDGADLDAWYAYANLSETGLTAEQITKATVKLATVMGARLVEIEETDRPAVVKVIVYDGEDTLAETVPWAGDTVASILEPVTLGPYEDGTPARIDLSWKHTLVCGTTNMGKSGVLNLILCKTMPAQDLVRILIDCKEGAPEFRAYRDVSFHVATDLEDAMRTLAGLEGIYRYRGRLLVEKDVAPEENEAGETVQKWRAEFGPFILCSIDELTEVTKKVKGAADRIQSLRATMRFVGEFALDATQFPAKDTFGGTTTARMNYLNRVSLPIAEQGGTNIIFGQGMHGRGWRPDMLDLPGKFLMSTPTNKRPRKARAERFEPSHVARMVADWRGRVPEMDEGSAQAFWEAYHAEDVTMLGGNGGGGPRGGKPAEPQDAPPVTYGRPHLVVVPRYPDGEEIADQDVRLWQLLGEYGRDGTVVKQLAARAEVLGHKYKSQPWVRGRCEYWEQAGYVESRMDGREKVFWRTDLRSEREDADGAAS